VAVWVLVGFIEEAWGPMTDRAVWCNGGVAFGVSGDLAVVHSA
jgi:hypothetical protein